MSPSMLDYLRVAPEVQSALAAGQAVVALESTVITHGLPYPENLALARGMENEVRQAGAVPATIAVLDGWIRVGLQDGELERLAGEKGMWKISRRDLAPAILKKASGGTTVAGTMLAAHAAGIRVFATGGIGGVHRQPAWDISPDLPELARTPVIVVCAGAKAILDLPATLEYLETHGVPVVGYQTDEFPAFYSRRSGLRTSVCADSAGQAADLARIHWELGFQSGVLIAAPLPESDAISEEAVAGAIEQALQEMVEQSISGQGVTPFLLGRVNQLTGGASLRANLALLHNNARIAAEIAGALV